jgi:sugar lactone lactonase YvrE
VEFHTVVSGFGSLEGPVIDEDGTMYVGDLKQHAVFSITTNLAVQRLVDRAHVGGLALHRNGGLVLSGDSVVHWREGQVRDLLTVSDLPARNGSRPVRFNDIVADPDGRVVAGVQREDERGNRAAGALVRIDAPGECTEILDGLHPNGIAYSSDGRRLFAADTYGRRLIVLALDADGTPEYSHSISTQEIDGLPDGVVADVDDGVWVAFYLGGCVVRFDPDTGASQVHPTPASKPLSVCFGRIDPSELFVVTGRHPDADEPFGGVLRALAGVEGCSVSVAAV